jgi:protein involved in polysaccharide export with SLBB domain
MAIYATSGESVPRVLAALRDFGPSLPVTVAREGRWIETPPEELAQWRADSGDVLALDVQDAPDLSKVLWVDADGSLWLPKVGEVKVRGLSLAEVNEAVRAKAETARVTLLVERHCHVLVAGNVVRALDETMDCGTTAARALERAGARGTDAIDPYVWREENGALRRVAFDYTPANDAAARAIALRGGDILIVK